MAALVVSAERSASRADDDKGVAALDEERGRNASQCAGVLGKRWSVLHTAHDKFHDSKRQRPLLTHIQQSKASFGRIMDHGCMRMCRFADNRLDDTLQVALADDNAARADEESLQTHGISSLGAKGRNECAILLTRMCPCCFAPSNVCILFSGRCSVVCVSSGLCGAARSGLLI